MAGTALPCPALPRRVTCTLLLPWLSLCAPATSLPVASWLEVTALRSAPCLPQPGRVDHRTRGL